MEETLEIKKKIKSEIFNKISEIDEIISITIVGSFIDKNDLSGISDIDVIVICKSLDKKKFNIFIDSFKKLDIKECGLDNYNLKINSTLGPLKFDKHNTAVLHLMIYDIKGHQNHVINSPFTCYDWERSKDFVGLHLKQVFPVGRIQFRDFKEARRSTENYLADLKNNTISFREYELIDNKFKQVKKNMPMDPKHKGEFAYHIVKNLVSNYIKFLSNKNQLISKSEIRTFLLNAFNKKRGKYHSEKFTLISKIKDNRKDDFPENTTEWAEEFIKEFKTIFLNKWRNAIKISFFRHFKTSYNDGSYLGQSRNPNIDLKSIIKDEFEEPNIIYSSPLARCIQSANIIYKNSNLIYDNRLLEFNYGDAEGLKYEEFLHQYPHIISDWKNGKDPCFPNGENTNQVFNRLFSFLRDLSKTLNKSHINRVSIFTHNGILRCLIGNFFQIDKKDWFKIFIPHGTQIEFLYLDEEYYPNISKNILPRILKNIGLSS
ncbi:MAG: histidine phosphatase family protein [Candidatus Neomarinimicrobiota bacterium]